jgi:hypothetical protein
MERADKFTHIQFIVMLREGGASSKHRRFNWCSAAAKLNGGDYWIIRFRG